MGKKKLLLSISITLASIGMLMANSDDLFKKADEDHERIVEMQTQYVRRQSFVERIPFIIRLCLGFPLWLLGTLIIKFVSTLIKIVISPVITFVLSALLIFFILLIVVVIVLKLLFPNKKIRELVDKEMIFYLFISSIIIKIIDIFFKNSDYRYLIIFILGLIVIVPIIIKKSREPVIIY